MVIDLHPIYSVGRAGTPGGRSGEVMRVDAAAAQYYVLHTEEGHQIHKNLDGRRHQVDDATLTASTAAVTAPFFFTAHHRGP